MEQRCPSPPHVLASTDTCIHSNSSPEQARPRCVRAAGWGLDISKGDLGSEGCPPRPSPHPAPPGLQDPWLPGPDQLHHLHVRAFLWDLQPAAHHSRREPQGERPAAHPRAPSLCYPVSSHPTRASDWRGEQCSSEGGLGVTRVNLVSVGSHPCFLNPSSFGASA